MKKHLLLVFVSLFAAHTIRGQNGLDTLGFQARISAQQRFIQTFGDQWTIRAHERTGTPASIFVTVPAGKSGGPLSNVPLSGASAEAKAKDFFARYSEMFGFRPGPDQFQRVFARQHRGFTHVRLKQTYRGIPVYGGDYSVTMDDHGRLNMVSGQFFPQIVLKTTPNILPEQAVATAISTTETRSLRRDPDVDLVIYPDKNRYALAYKVLVLASNPPHDWLVFVDAVSGDTLEMQDVMQDFVRSGQRTDPAGPVSTRARSLSTFTTGTGYVYEDNPMYSSISTVSLLRLAGSGFQLYGTYVNAHNEDVTDAYSSSATFLYSASNTHFDEVNAYYHIDAYAAYLPSISFPGLGRTIDATVHYGDGYNNAFYDVNNTDDLFFGDGDGIFFNDFAKENDVMYHEFGHAVLTHLGIGYNNSETGAMQEGTADYLAASHVNNPRIGEWVTICTDTGDLRTVSNSKTYFKYSNRTNVEYSYCSAGGYYNNPQGSYYAQSMIWSGTLWDLRGAIGKDKTDQLVIDAFNRLGQFPTFSQGRDALIQSDNATNAGANVCQIQIVFAARGIGSTCTNPPPPTPTNLAVQNSSQVGEHPHLVWVASSGATSYVVERCYSSTGSCDDAFFYTIGTPTTTFFDDYNTTINAGYTCSSVPRQLTLYRVSARNSYGTSDPTPHTTTCASNGSFKTAPEASELPSAFALHGNAPNPFRTSTEIRFDLPEAAHVKLAVYNMLGQEVRELVSADLPAGFQHVTFNPEGLASGVYLYRITAGTFTETKRMVVAK